VTERPAKSRPSLQAIIDTVLKRQKTGSVLCTSCGVLVGVNDATCYNCGRRNPGMWGFGPALRSLGADFGFVPFVIGTCIIVYGLALLASRGNIGMRGLTGLFAPSLNATFALGASGAVPVFVYNRWWTVLSAAWVHGSAIHILVNMMWVRDLAPVIADTYGAGRMIIIYTTAAITGFILSSVMGHFLPYVPILGGSQYTVGASGSIFGLLGALVYYGRRGGSSMMGRQAMSYALMMGFFGFIMPGVDNYAHLGGFAGGYAAGRFLDPLEPERGDHLVIAVACLALSVISVAFSVWHAFQPMS
jgi:rhomboid protease GluP